MRLILARITAVVIAISLWIPAHAVAQPWDGWWVWSIDGRNAFVLALRGSGEGVSGELSKPSSFTLDANAGWVRFSNVEGPPATDPLLQVVNLGSELRFGVQECSGSQEVTAYVLRRTFGETATLGLANIPGAPTFEMRRFNVPVQVSEDWEPGQIYGQPPAFPDNADLAELFRQDQAARQGSGPLNPGVAAADEERRAAARRMLDEGSVRSGADYYHASFIFQHGDKPDDYLLAHALATSAIARGRADAIWIATASLDRFLQSIGRSQIYGTQFIVPHDGSQANQGNYDRHLLPDTVRTDSGVPPLAAQEQQLGLLSRPPQR